MQLLSSRVVAPDRFKGNGMLNGKRIAVVLPAYNAEKTLEATVRELPDLVDIRILVELPLLENSDDFVFDNQVLAQCVHFGFRIGEVSCPTKYFEEGSSINFRRSVTYGLGVLGTTLQFALQKMGVARFRLFSAKGRRLEPGYVTYYARGAIGAAQKQ